MHLKPSDKLVSRRDLAALSLNLGSGDIAMLGTSLNASGVGVVGCRYQQELAWLSHLPGLSGPASRLLAAHAAGGLGVLQGLQNGAFQDGGVFAQLSATRPDHAALMVADMALRGADDHDPDLTQADMACIDALWPLAAPTECLLASGGDDRLALDARTGLNKYGCAPWPLPDVISFGSCTASSLSEGAFLAAETARRALIAASLATSPATALATASEAISVALLRHFGVEDLAQAVLAASGTDAALVVTGLLTAERPGDAITSILMSPSETGSGVPNAVQGRHFASCAPSGSLVGKGQPIDGLATGPSLVTIALRDLDGMPRPQADIVADCDAAIRRGIDSGRAILHAMDGSKTGLTAPDRTSCQRLAEAYGDRLDIVIDACQARIEPALVQWYLRHGFPVLITGSKFFGAPGFCGAVLFPRARLERIARAGRLPAGLAAYARLQGGFGSRRCPGLVLRWSASLHEMAAFGALPPETVRRKLDDLGGAIMLALAQDDRFRLMPAPRPTGMGWSDRRSVFTFMVRGQEGWMDPGALRGIYRALDQDVSGAMPLAFRELAVQRCQIGQPVELGCPRLGGLRLAISAAQLVAGADQADRLAIGIGKLRALLDLGGVGH
jgi:hypothetical protein